MNILLFFNGVQLGNHLHPFLLFELDTICSNFDEVHLFCLEPECGWKEVEQFKNLQIHSRKKSDLLKNMYCFFPLFFRGGVGNDLLKSIKDRVFDFGYIKELIKIVVPGYIMAKKAKKVIKKSNTNDFTSISYWFSCTAYATALVKRDYPQIKSLTRAHSSEVDIERNRYCRLSLKKFMINNLDMICFVSEIGYRVFEEEILPNYKNFISIPQLKVVRLGTTKNYNDLNPKLLDLTFRIISCSRAVPLKRLSLLAKSISIITNINIIWTHFGDGPCMDEVLTIMKKSGPNIKFVRKGSVENSEIHHYYANNSVDCFVNVSLFEGIPVSIMEALSYGIPVLATNAGGTRELINDSNGKLIDTNISVETLSQKIVDLYEILKNDNQVNIIRKNAFNTWKDKCDFLKNSKYYLDVIKRMIAKEKSF